MRHLRTFWHWLRGHELDWFWFKGVRLRWCHSCEVSF